MRSHYLSTCLKGRFWSLPSSRTTQQIGVPFRKPSGQPRQWPALTQLRAATVDATQNGPNLSGSSTPTVRVQGPSSEDQDNHKANLISQLKSIPQDTSSLRIEENTPSDKEWSILSEHFINIRDLEMNSGYDEGLNDKEMPLHWPLERLEVSSAAGEVIQTPFILQGRVKHLALIFTSGLRFEGPTNAELQRTNREAIDRGDATPRYLTVDEGTPAERKIEVTYIPELVAQWMTDKYSKPNPQVESANRPPAQVTTDTLEIVENDALDAFCRMAVALPHVVDNLQTLTLRSTHGLDFQFARESMFVSVLPHLLNLRTLRLSVGDIFEDEQYLPNLYTKLPPNLSALYFRGPASLCQSEKWEKWIESFASKEYLPELKKLGFVLDLHYEGDKNGKKEVQAPEAVLREARAACDRLYAVAKDRGITIEAMHDGWADEFEHLRQVDDRWGAL
ncbi:uncharacterized protein NFIA_106890 [Aspergillus fischeri NRRL 181]|uniref:Uncharacterized protein n=1 Tax=Neosartorya fischeri (strain ATCC 1020 / DSM 3700 / CBS 544.65 / FGSC A1164 / JCM 1740 / NRRL 181 / WB 181) TaxID=331117 RepID=A1CX48_NEOFI|nr:conserved hypothetical protein [Aspergillus fischeri NRRL 181]EAW25200.1 conserved hypothetical protein [Aspergillus fischeri NRRL 181]KAG2027008.1 hypothetical protein GB937_000744 [Aspergillus fischeri]